MVGYGVGTVAVIITTSTSSDSTTTGTGGGTSISFLLRKVEKGKGHCVYHYVQFTRLQMYYTLDVTIALDFSHSYYM